MSAFLTILGAVLIGGTLGLLGSGGSILTVPVLVYLADQPEKLAVASSLLIVGVIAAVASLQYLLRRRVSIRHVVAFGLPGMAGAWLGAMASAFIPGEAQLLLFAAIMLTAGILMFRPHTAEPRAASNAMLIVSGTSVGALTGLVGVGGGFLIVPALLVFGGLVVHEAVGTSLAIIALNAGTGFVAQRGVIDAQGLQLDWWLIALFIAVGIAGSTAGSVLGNRLPQLLLRRAFAIVVLLIALLIGGNALMQLMN